MRSKLERFELWLVLGWLLVATIIVLTLIAPPERIPQIEFEDKIAHVAAYGMLMLWFAQLYLERRARFSFAAAFIAMGIVLEFGQGALGYRSFEYADMVANGFGVVTGALLAVTNRCNFLLALDRTLASAQR
jgi:VanZ family protein